MKLQALDVSWHIIVVVMPQNVHQLRQTLDDLTSKSYSSDISVLASDDSVVRGALAGLELEVEFALPPVIKTGSYWAAIVGHHHFEASRNIFLFAGTRVPEHWDARLAAAGQRNAAALAIAPLCVRHPILSAFTSPEHESNLSVDDVDQWLNDYAEGMEFTVPVMLESCLLLQGEYWRQSSLQFEDDQDLLDSLRYQGQWLLATDHLYVDDSTTTCNCDISFLPPAFLAAYSDRHPLVATRHALTELSSRGEKPVQVRHSLPVELHVGHSWGGGLSRWIENYIEADTSHNHLVLRSIGDRSAFGQQIALYPGAEMAVPIRTWVLSEPIRSTVVSQYEYSQLLHEIIEEFHIESLTISSLIGHSMDLLRTTVPTTYVLHDFFPFCPALYACFDTPCQSCDADELQRCASSNPLHSYFKLEPTNHWLQVRGSFLDLIGVPGISLVAPSESVVRRYETLEPRMQQRRIHILEHGLSGALVDRFSSVRGSMKPAGGGRLRILMLGRITPEKGALLLAEIIEDLAEFSDIWLLGAGENGQQFRGVPGVTVVEEYSMLELHKHLKTISPHMGLLLSIVPETFSYTLSEMWAAGIPVLATRLGAFSDRIEDGRNGWLEPLDAQSIKDRIVQINEDRDALEAIRESLLKQSVRTSRDMVMEYQMIKPPLEHVPLQRYFLPRKSYQNPYEQKHQERKFVLYIDRQATYRGVLREFLQYSAQKAEQTPRLPDMAKRALKALLDRCVRSLSPQNDRK